jgi:hypothetical protein
VERRVGSRETEYCPTGCQVGRYSAADQAGNCIIVITLWYYEKSVEELRITMFKCCNSALQTNKKKRQLRWPNAYDHREVIQSNGVAPLALKKNIKFSR